MKSDIDVQTYNILIQLIGRHCFKVHSFKLAGITAIITSNSGVRSTFLARKTKVLEWLRNKGNNDNNNAKTTDEKLNPKE